ncbi:MAG: EamA family transporter [Lachnospiraceae bacterium]|nr:EamA family transporter [Lachnospiraceae bacterium]
MNSWFIYIVIVILLWAMTGLIYKAGIHSESEKHICLKYSVSVGVVFFAISLFYLVTRDEPFTIWESAIRYWPMTVFGIIYFVINTISFNGYIYNEVTVECPVEGISGGTSTVLLIATYLIMGKANSASKLMTPLRTAGIVIILLSIILLASVRNREERSKRNSEACDRRTSWKTTGLGTLIFPFMFSMVDALETVVTGVCLDRTYGYSMPAGDSIIIVGMEYSILAFGCWIYILIADREFYRPFKKENLPRLLGSVTDNAGIVFYSYAMAIDSVSTDPVLAVYPVVAMIGGRIFMKEKVSKVQYISVICIVLGSVMVVADAIT